MARGRERQVARWMRRPSSVRPMVRPVASALVVALLGGLLGIAAEVVEPPAPADASGAPSDFVAVTPCRVLDTRLAVPVATIGPGVSRSFQVGGSGAGFAAQGGAAGGCAVPDGVSAVELSFTVIAPSGAAGFLRAGPAGAVPTGTIVNYTVGTGITNTGTVALAAAGTLDLAVRNEGGTVHLAVDVLGYFTTASGTRFVPVSPCRMVDTRSTSAAAFNVDETRTFRIGGTGTESFPDPGVVSQGGRPGGCGIPAQATAVELTVTAAAPEGTGFLRIGPNTPGDPAATLLNFTTAQGITNTGSVPLAGAGFAKVKVFGARTQVLIDVQGYYEPANGNPSRFVPLSPCRIVDTRSAIGGAPVGVDEIRSFGAWGAALSGQGGLADCGIPAGAAAIEVSITAVSPTGTGFLRIWPAVTPEPPTTLLNYTGSRGVTNTATVPLNRTGSTQLEARAFGAATHVVLDVQGYYSAALGATSVDLGLDFGCVINSSALVECWGGGGVGQLGGGEFIAIPRPQPRPVTMPGAATPTQVVTGEFSACARLNTGRVACWGLNSSGQLGNGVSSNASTPGLVPSASIVNITQISAGDNHVCAVRTDNTVWCWGANGSGQLGNTGAGTTSTVPVQVTGLTSVTQVSAGGNSTCARRTDGSARCWGSNSYGQLGNGTLTSSTAPVTVNLASPANVASVAVGKYTSCAVRTDGTVRCWGRNVDGELGNGSTDVLVTSPVATTITGVRTTGEPLVAGVGVFCAISTAAVLWCWGDGSSFQFADGGVGDRRIPGIVRNGVSAVALGGDQLSGGTCAVDTDTGLRCWGRPGYLSDITGLGTMFGGSAMTPGSGPVLPFGADISLSRLFPGSFGCANSSGQVRCWGLNSLGGLGDGTTTNQLLPVAVSGVTTATSLSVGAAHACAVVGGNVRCWGAGASGALGNGSLSDSLIPVTVSSLGGTATAVAASTNSTCALLSIGTVRCWGTGSSGQLGNGSTAQQLTPVSVTGLSGVTQITAGDSHYCALAGASVRCWGYNFQGQLGDGTSGNQRNAPVVVPGLSGVTRLVAGYSHTCAQLGDGTVRCWGDNSSGAIGDGTTSFSPVVTPTPVTGLTGVTDLSAGGYSTCAVTGGTVRCWGRNYFGQLGDGTNLDRAAPVTVRNLTGVVDVDAGQQSVCAELADGTHRCWGSLAGGGLGTAPLTANPRSVQRYGF